MPLSWPTTGWTRSCTAAARSGSTRCSRSPSRPQRAVPDSPEAGIERAEFFDLARAHTRIVCRDVDGLRILVSTSDCGYGRALFLRGRRPDMRMLPAALDVLSRRGIAPGGCFVDVGANIGTTTFTALTACGFATAVAIEPDETNAALVLATAALNGFGDRVRVVRAAALDDENGARLRRHRTSSARHTVDPDGDVSVPSVRLDGLGLEGVGMIWIDAEGSEGQVFDGARGLLRARPPIVFEFNPQSLRRHHGLESVMRVALGYAERLHPSTGEPLELERLADELDGHGGRRTRRVDVLLVP